MAVTRRQLVAVLGGAAGLLIAASGQQSGLPVIGFDHDGGFALSRADAFRKGLNDADFIDGQNATAEYNWLYDQFDRLTSLMAELVRHRVAVIAAPAGNLGRITSASYEAQAWRQTSRADRHPR
jgi:putative ABC transport system substrate-binding protein